MVVSGVWNAYQEDTASADCANKRCATNGLSQRKTQLDSDIAKLRTERGQEAVLRDQYALAAKGEDMVIIENASGTAVRGDLIRVRAMDASDVPVVVMVGWLNLHSRRRTRPAWLVVHLSLLLYDLDTRTCAARFSARMQVSRNGWDSGNFRQAVATRV